jgi:hypothetical protein
LEQTPQRPSFKLEKDTVLVNGSSEGSDDPTNELDNDYQNDVEERTHFKRVHKNAFARRFLLMK